MIALLGLLLTAQHQGDIKISSGPIAFAETGQRGAVLELTSTGLWRYSETLKEWLPIFAADIRNVSTTAWRDLELTLVISGPDKAEFRIPMTVGSIIEPGETLPYEKFFFGKVGADQLRSASSFSLEMSSASKKQNIPFQGFSGIWLQAEDCAQDHQSLMKLTGIALRERLLKFVSLGCGARVCPPR